MASSNERTDSASVESSSAGTSTMNPESQTPGKLAIPQPYILRKSVSMLEVLPQEIDIDEEIRMYEDMCDVSRPLVTIPFLLTLVIHKTPIVGSLSDEETAETSRRTVPRSRLKRPDSVFSQDSQSIWLADNSGNACNATNAFAQNVQIVGWTSVADKKGGAYIVYDCAIHTKEGAVVHVHKRYRAFEQLCSRLRATLPAYQQRLVPPLPPKNPLSKFRATFLDKRRRALQHWLASVMLHPDIGGCEAIRHWVIDS